jgi:EF hand
MLTPLPRCAFLLTLAATLVGCSAAPVQQVRFVPVSLSGDRLSAPSSDPAPYRNAMQEWFRRTDTNHDGQLSPPEAQADAQNSFKRYDLNKDSFVTSSELTEYRVASAYYAPPAQGGARTLRGKADVTPQEADTAIREGSGSRPRYRMGIDPVMAADADANFRVEPLELERFVLQRLAELDRNGDGLASQAEFMLYAEGPMRAWPQ